MEKETLQARLKTLSADAEAAAALRAENQLLKKQVADLKAAPPPASKTEEASRQLAQAQAQIAALQSDKDMLRLEKTALENRVKQLSAPPVAHAKPPAPAKTPDAARIKQLERERDGLQKQLAAANKELYSRKGKAAAARKAEIESQLATLRGRLEVLEARQVPYTAEELALFKQPETKLAQVDAQGWPEIGQGAAPRHRGARGGSAPLLRQQADSTRPRKNTCRCCNRTKRMSLPWPTSPRLNSISAISRPRRSILSKPLALAPDDPYSLLSWAA